MVKKEKSLENSIKTLKSLNASPQALGKAGFKINHDGKKRSAYEILGYKEASWELINDIWPELKKLRVDQRLKKQIKTNSFYERYSSRYLAEIDDLNKERSLKIRKNTDFDGCAVFSNEIKEILKRYKPASIGEARQLPGMTPAAANVLLRYVKIK